jgi:hypothetical protein
VPLFITAFVLIIHRVFHLAGMLVTLAPVFPLVVMSVWYGNIYASTLTATLVSVYAILTIDDPIRAIIIVASLALTVAPMQFSKWNLNRTGTVANLLEQMRETHSLYLSLMVNWPDMSDEERWKLSEAVYNKNTKVFAMVRGWHLLSLEQDSLDTEI